MTAFLLVFMMSFRLFNNPLKKARIIFVLINVINLRESNNILIVAAKELKIHNRWSVTI